MRIASFFCGVGGFDLGLQRAGHEVVYACEKALGNAVVPHVVEWIARRLP